MKNPLKIFSVLMLFVIVLAACAPVVGLENSAGKPAMIRIYDMTFETVNGAWLVPTYILGIGLAIAALIFFSKSESGCAGLIAAGVLLVVIIGGGYLLANSFATTDATAAVTIGADKAKTRKANQYIEKLHIPVTKTVLDKRQCYESDGGTGCKYYWTYNYNFHQDCTTVTDYDSEGNANGSHQECHEDHDTRYVPYFSEEWMTSALFSMPDEYLVDKVGEDAKTGLVKSELPNMPRRVYTDWQAPENYQDFYWGPSNRDGSRQPEIGAFEYVIPMEWKVMDAALKAGLPYTITVWHSYVNWVFVTSDSNNLVTTSSQVGKYQSADLLPQVNMIYSKYATPNQGLWQDYDFLQFHGGLVPENVDAWQQAASYMALKVGPVLQGSMVIWFVPAQSVDNPDSWIQAAKAYLSEQEKWGFYMAPKNLILIGCGVDTATNTISFCRMETGMPSGNLDIKQTISEITGVPFTSQGVFGTLNPSATVDANGFYNSSLDIPQDGFIRLLFPTKDADGKVINPGFVRVRMGTMDWLKTDIKLDDADIVWAVTTTSQSARDITFWLSIVSLMLVGVCIFGAVSNEDY